MGLHTDARLDCYRLRDEPGYRYLTKPLWIQGVFVISNPEALFKWDGASAPRLLTPVIAKFDHSLYSSCLHDFLCQNAKNKEERLRADKLYRISLVEDDKQTKWTAWRGYIAVRIGAWWGTGVNYPHGIKDNVWPMLGLK